jgi:hypothetical protein
MGTSVAMKFLGLLTELHIRLYLLLLRTCLNIATRVCFECRSFAPSPTTRRIELVLLHDRRLVHLYFGQRRCQNSGHEVFRVSGEVHPKTKR